MDEIQPLQARPGVAGGVTVSARSRVTFLLCIIYALMYLDRVNLSAAARAIKLEFGLSNAQLGVAFTGFSWAYLLTVLFGGWAARRYGARIVLMGCAVLLGVSTMAMSLAAGAVSLFLIRMLVGAGEGPAFPAATQTMRHWYPAEKFGYIQGITHSASRLGAALAPPLVAWLIVATNWRLSFVVCGAVVLAWSAAWWLQFRDDPECAPGQHKTYAGATPRVPRPTGPTPLWALTKRMLPVTMVMFAYGWTYWIFVSWLPLYFMNSYHVNLKSSALLSSIPLLTGMVGNTVGGMLSDHLLRRTKNSRAARCSVVAGSLIGCALALTPLAFKPSLEAAVACLACAMFFLELTIAPMYAVPMDMTREFAGLGSAYIIIGVALAGITSPIVFGWLIDLTGNWNIPFAAAITILVLGAAAVLLVRPDRPFVAPAI
ncbi:MAG: MFS transporter [Burkholderiales bacterium]|nr:MFS transporter [Burkholderiales bacterium]